VGTFGVDAASLSFSYTISDTKPGKKKTASVVITGILVPSYTLYSTVPRLMRYKKRRYSVHSQLKPEFPTQMNISENKECRFFGMKRKSMLTKNNEILFKRQEMSARGHRLKSSLYRLPGTR